MLATSKHVFKIKTCRNLFKNYDLLSAVETFSSICLGNDDMLIGASNLSNTIYSITTDFDGVGVLGAVNAMCSYAEDWTNVSSLALSGAELAVCADGVLHVFVPSQARCNKNRPR